MSLGTAQEIVRGNRISFTTSYQFNDPYEMHAISNFCHIINDSDPTITLIETDYSLLKTGLQCFGVLSLTRNPLNHLMWSHYGDEHRGVVIGFDVDRADFCNVDSNVIPANKGEIIYTKTFPDHLKRNQYKHTFNNLRSLSSYTPETAEFFKYAYLYKGLDWAYEEEVRVVKAVGWPHVEYQSGDTCHYKNSNGDWAHRNLNDNKDLNLCKFPSEAIREIYFGMSVHGMKNYESILDHINSDVMVRCCNMGGLKTYEIGTNHWK